MKLLPLLFVFALAFLATANNIVKPIECSGDCKRGSGPMVCQCAPKDGKCAADYVMVSFVGKGMCFGPALALPPPPKKSA